MRFHFALTVFLAIVTRGWSDEEVNRQQTPRPGVTVQLPTLGVAVDAAGVLRVQALVQDEAIVRQQRAAAINGRRGDVMRPSALRKVSLRRLDAAIVRRLSAGEVISDAMQHLAGLQRVRFVFCYPELNDIVLAGPAEGWLIDATGRAVGMPSGRSVIGLDDLAVALRQFLPGENDRPFVGCTINPGAGAMERLQRFQQTIPKSIRESEREFVARRILQGTQEALGLADVHVFGIGPTTNMAAVMVEADYRMKRIAVGVEAPPVPMKTFIDALRRAPRGVQRWWFAPVDKCLRSTKDGLAVEIGGEGVQLLTENLVVGPQGALAHGSAKPSAAATAYATAFTKKYPAIARRAPVFGALRNMIDLLVTAAHLQSSDAYGRVQWTPEALTDETMVRTERLVAPQHAPCAVNVVWKGSRLIAPAGGGISIVPHHAIESAEWVDDLGLVDLSQEVASDDGDWWWD